MVSDWELYCYINSDKFILDEYELKFIIHVGETFDKRSTLSSKDSTRLSELYNSVQRRLNFT